MMGLRDGSVRRSRLFVLAAAWFVSLVIGGQTCAQLVDTTDENWVYRYDIFQAFLQRDGLLPTPTISEVLESPHESTIVLMGEVRRESVGTWIKLKEFVDLGGRILIAPDNFHSTVYFGETQPGPAKARLEESKFSGFDDCVRVTRFRSSHPLVSNLTELVTNRAGAIRRIGITGDSMQLAFLPDDCYPSEFAGKSILATGETQTNGAMVVLADPSILSNGMFSFGDNGEFASRLANYLSTDSRSKLFMSVDGQPVRLIRGIAGPRSPQGASAPEEGEPATTEPQFQTLLEVANSALQELANPEQINSRLKDQPRSINKRQYVIFVISALTVLLLLWGAVKLLSRSNRWLKYRRSVGTVTAESMLRNGYPGDVKNRMASEALAREFSRRWTGLSTASDWRQWLDDMRHDDRDKLPAEDRVALESLLAIAVFGGKTPMPDHELSKLSQQMCDLLQRYRQDVTLV
ncbi:MAG: hypothetical protein MUC43_07270 [Pirellula sp.]|jgi:hypothetical protein|nr:hypothetical protein [Pirellula sp.]